MKSDLSPILIFDFDGTIADSLNEAFLAANRIAVASGVRTAIPKDKEALRAMSFRQIMKAFHVPLLRIPRMLVRMRAELFSSIDAIEPIPGIPEVLLELKRRGLKLGIVTSNSRQMVQRFLSYHHIEVFDFGMYSAGLWSKARQIRMVVRKNRLDRNQVYYVGDTQEDIAAGKAAGAHTVAVTWGYASSERLAAVHPQFIVDKPEQLLMFGEPLEFEP
jgi:phosphoglycolate phosphatase-like HAD superfamily hydrolase